MTGGMKPSYVTVEAKNEQKSIWNITFTGAQGTPHEGGKFVMVADMTDNYPFKAPKCKFLTKIYHPNVTDEGDICKAVYEDDWKPVSNMKLVCERVYNFIAAPTMDAPVNGKIAK